MRSEGSQHMEMEKMMNKEIHHSARPEVVR